MTDAYPLAWPDGWPRSDVNYREDSERFSTFDRRQGIRAYPTFAHSRDRLRRELERLGAVDVVISSNHPIDRNGWPIESKRRVQDDGVAVYFQLRKRSLVMACDRFRDAAGNMSSLALAIDAMRQLERHGGGTMMDRAFTGFLALPAAGPKWFVVLGVQEGATAEEIQRAYKLKSLRAHPDTGGSHAAMAELNVARDEGMRQARATT